MRFHSLLCVSVLCVIDLSSPWGVDVFDSDGCDRADRLFLLSFLIYWNQCPFVLGKILLDPDRRYANRPDSIPYNKKLNKNIGRPTKLRILYRVGIHCIFR